MQCFNTIFNKKVSGLLGEGGAPSLGKKIMQDLPRTLSVPDSKKVVGYCWGHVPEMVYNLKELPLP